MTPDDRDDGQQAWVNEYEMWAAEEEASDIETLNRLLRAVGDGTVYDPRNHDKEPT